jgi:hypothetical protein
MMVVLEEALCTASWHTEEDNLPAKDLATHLPVEFEMQ